MRKHLGVLASVVVLCAASWTQTPAPAPSTQTSTPEATPLPTTIPLEKQGSALEFPRIELFVGGTYAEAGFFNAGHWAGLPGWDVSLGLNATNWIGLLVEGGQYFGTSKIPTSAPAPFPNCPPFCPNGSPTFNASTREYNFLFGVQFARRKYAHWTPIGQLMYGHQGARGEATAELQTFTEVGTGRALVAGGGIDYKVTPRLALRVKADYLGTATAFSQQPKQKQDNFRLSVGVVIRNLHKKKRTLEDDTQPEQ